MYELARPLAAPAESVTAMSGVAGWFDLVQEKVMFMKIHISSPSRLIGSLGLIMMVFFLSTAAPALAQTPLQASAQAMIDPGAPMAVAPEAKYSPGDLRTQYGAGLRYMCTSPPLRIEYGKPLDRSPEDSSGQWEFTMGSMF